MASGSAFLVLICAFTVPFKCAHCQCGVPELTLSGRDIFQVSKWPWHATVFHRLGNFSRYQCGGTLISARFVLTAESSLRSTEGFMLYKGTVFVQLGVHSLDASSANDQQVRSVNEIHYFEDAIALRKYRNDIALIELDGEVEFGMFVRPVCLNRDKDLMGQLGTILGWGNTESEELSPMLKEATARVVDAKKCQSSDQGGEDRSLVCAGHLNGTEVCIGDDGGGLVFQRGNVWFLGGVLLRMGIQLRNTTTGLCHSDGFVGFTSVQQFLPWIAEVTNLPSLEEFRKMWRGESEPTEKLQLPRSCGLNIVKSIAGDQKASLYEFPWMAILHYEDPVRFCSGTLISSRYVLSAARCFHGFAPEYVRLGDFTLDDCHPDDTRTCAPPVLDVERVLPHPHFSTFLNLFDIGLVRLANDVSFQDHIQPICLPVTDELRTLKLPQYTVTGWGSTSGKVSSTLLKTTVSPMQLLLCPGLGHWDMYQDAQLCAGVAESNNACTGDAGSPLGQSVQFNGVVRFVQFGVLSHGYGCNSMLTAFTNVSEHLDWIVDNMAAMSGKR